MEKKNIWVVVAIIVLAILAYLFVFNKRSSAPTTDTSIQGSSQSTGGTDQATSSSQSLQELVAKGSSVKCTYGESGSEGTMYISSGKARGDFSAGTQKGHMVMMDKTSYIWMDGSSQGFKSSLDTSAPTTAAANSGTASQGVDASKKMNYSCSPWSADASMFTLPTSVQFMDASAMMQVPTK